MSTLKRFSAPIAITLVITMAFAVSACAQNCQAYDPISLSVTPSEKTVCVGETVTMTLTASDGDYCGDPANCWDNLTFSGWPGSTPTKDGQGVYRSTYNRQYDSPGTHTYNVYADDTGACFDEVTAPGVGPQIAVIHAIGGPYTASRNDLRYYCGIILADTKAVLTAAPNQPQWRLLRMECNEWPRDN